MTASRRGLPFVVSAPSGTGKTTVCRSLVAIDPCVTFSISHTTRPPRPGERDEVEYHFVSEDEFRRLAAEGAFLEHASYSGNLYGTSWAAIDAPLARGVDVLLEIETEGARQVRKRRSDAVLIFLLPPSLAELERRLRGRGTDPAEEVTRRLEIARREFEAASLFDAFAINDRLEASVEEVRAIIAEVRRGGREALPERFGLARLRTRLDPQLAAWLPG